MTKLGLADLEVHGRRVLVRVDFNVPLTDEGAIADDSRIVAALPTIRILLDRGASVVLMSHLGRPGGVVDPKLSLKPCAARLGELLGQPVVMAPDCVGIDVQRMARRLAPGEVLMLENLRFYEAETKPEADPTFADQLASLGDIYINDAFGTAHRKHSSTYQVAQKFPDSAAAGLLLERELVELGALVENPSRPFIAIIGGKKVSSKLAVLASLVDKVDTLIIVGAMAFTFAKAQGLKVGGSLVEDELIQEATAIIEQCHKKGVNLIQPVDSVVADSFSEDASSKLVAMERGIPEGWLGLDIGPSTIQSIAEAVSSAKTIFWNGAPGVFELPKFAKGTRAIATILAHSKATTIAGGGDTLSAIHKAGVDKDISHLSTGGGASLEFIQYGTLPAVQVLTEKQETLH